MSEDILMKPVAHIRTDFPEKFGIPRQSGTAGLMGRIVFVSEYRNPSALKGLDGFSHLWLIFDFSKAHRKGWNATVRPPVLGGNERMGVFATRSPFRPNPVGLSSVRLIGIEHTATEGDVLIVEGIDMLDGTPIIDIKPYIPSSDCHIDATAGFSEVGKERTLDVQCPQELLEKVPENKRAALLNCLAQDVRPSYQGDGRKYGMCFSGLNISFYVENRTLFVLSID